MRGQKVSIRSSISEELGSSSRRHFPLFSEEDEQEEEIDNILAERNKCIAYNESKRRFHEERDKRKKFSSKLSKSQKNKQRRSQKNPLGIPVSEFIYFGSGPRGWDPADIFGNPPLKEEKEEDYKIIRSKGKAYRYEKTLSSHIFRILLKRGRPLHVNDIIIALQKLGVLKDKIHNYSVVYRTLTRDHAIFERLEKATFSLRQGFVAQEQPIKADRVLEEREEFASLQELVVDTYRHLGPIGGCCPADIYQLLKTLGFNGPYKTIYEAMQSTNFRRIGFVYYLVDEQA